MSKQDNLQILFCVLGYDTLQESESNFVNDWKQKRDTYFRHAINFNRHIDISVEKQSYP